jgi:hypothetical protein
VGTAKLVSPRAAQSANVFALKTTKIDFKTFLFRGGR